MLVLETYLVLEVVGGDGKHPDVGVPGCLGHLLHAAAVVAGHVTIGDDDGKADGVVVRGVLLYVVRHRFEGTVRVSATADVFNFVQIRQEVISVGGYVTEYYHPVREV